MKHFSDDYHVVAVDMRGYNKTDRPPDVHDYTLPNLCQDVVELIPALGHDKAILVAHDWGGGVAWTVADRHPEVVEKLIVMNCPHPAVLKKRIQSFSQRMKMWFILIPWFPEFQFSIGNCEILKDLFRGENGVCNKQSLTLEDVEAYRYVFSQPGALKYPINYYRGTFLVDMKYGPAITMPTLLIWGDSDAFFDLAVADDHGDVVPDLRVKHIEKCSHWVQNDNPERVNQHIREFLDE